jgi:hypothetical protein
VQLEFGFLLGPPDGRYLVRSEPDAEIESILVLRTLGAPQRRLLRGRKGRAVQSAEPAPVPTARATVVRPRPFGAEAEANAWLAALRGDEERREAELSASVRILNRALHAHRVARADASLPDLSEDRALVVRMGFGSGEAVADGRFDAAWEVPPDRRRTKRSMEAPEERFAAVLAGREEALPCEALVLRARADLDAGRPREAALQARVALESLIADLPQTGLESERGVVGDSANAALRGELPEDLERMLGEAVGRMETALRRRRLGG